MIEHLLIDHERVLSVRSRVRSKNGYVWNQEYALQGNESVLDLREVMRLNRESLIREVGAAIVDGRETP